jgi:hypothetical protein
MFGKIYTIYASKSNYDSKYTIIKIPSTVFLEDIWTSSACTTQLNPLTINHLINIKTVDKNRAHHKIAEKINDQDTWQQN